MTGDEGSAEEFSADPAPRPDAWQRFGEWRRTRPFWGGLFLLLSGIEFYLSGHLDVLPVKLSFGGQSFLAWIIPIALILCGVLVWSTPAQRAFYGILGAAISVAALIGLNLGGFFVGMLLGIAGGALAFSWTPDDAPAQPPADPEGRHPAALLIALIVAAGALILPARPAYSAPCRPAVPSPSVTASPAAQPSSSTPPANPIGDFFGQLGKLLGLGGGSTPSPSPSPAVSASPARTPAPCPSASPSASRTGKPPKLLAAPGAVVVNAVPSTQITARLSQSGLSFDGIVELPTHTGTIRCLQFSLRSSSSVPFELRVPTKGGTLSLRSTDLTVSGQVKFYTTEIKGRLFGLVPVTFTPDSPPPLVVPELFFTDATVALVYVHAATLTAPALHISYP